MAFSAADILEEFVEAARPVRGRDAATEYAADAIRLQETFKKAHLNDGTEYSKTSRRIAYHRRQADPAYAFLRAAKQREYEHRPEVAEHRAAYNRTEERKAKKRAADARPEAVAARAAWKRANREKENERHRRWREKQKSPQRPIEP